MVLREPPFTGRCAPGCGGTRDPAGVWEVRVAGLENHRGPVAHSVHLPTPCVLPRGKESCSEASGSPPRALSRAGRAALPEVGVQGRVCPRGAVLVPIYICAQTCAGSPWHGFGCS